MKKKIYIAGKVTGEPMTECTLKFRAAQVAIEKMGYEAVNPLEVVGDFKAPWDSAMKNCLSAMIGCDAIVLLPCWQDSKGAKIERQLAEDLGMLICNFNDFGLHVLKAQFE